MTQQTPRICILIPAYNEEVVIEGTIASLMEADGRKEHIYVVDDKSTDETAKIARTIGVNVYTMSENSGKAAAQRKAIQYFLLLLRYDWIIFMDGDTKVDKNFLIAFEQSAINGPEVGLYLGQVKSVKNNHIYSASRAFDYTYGQDIAKQGQSNFNVIFVAPGCASMYNCRVLENLEIDHTTLAEDMDLTMQVHRAKKRVVYVSDAIVNTQDPGTLNDYHKQVLRWYRGFWQTVKKHKIFSLCKKQPVDFYMILITIDALFLNRIFGLIFVMYMFPSYWIMAIIVDIAWHILISFYSAFKTKRLDVIYKLPVYYWLSYLNFYAYMRAFVEIVICKKELLAWNKVKRYDFNSHT